MTNNTATQSGADIYRGLLGVTTLICVSTPHEAVRKVYTCMAPHMNTWPLRLPTTVCDLTSSCAEGIHMHGITYEYMAIEVANYRL